MNYNQITEAIGRATLTDTELRNINELVIEKLKANRSIQAVSIKQSLKAGMAVMIDHQPHRDSVFTIDSIRRNRATIVDSQGCRMSAPISMLIPM